MGPQGSRHALLLTDVKNAQAQEGHQTVGNWNYYTFKSFRIVNFSIGNFQAIHVSLK
jgi:hypothetical protein